MCHYVLGLGLGIAPAASWIAVTGNLDSRIIIFTLAVMFWTAGFDIIYAMQDEEFDRKNELKSIPAKFGKKNSLLISRVSHIMSASCIVVGGVLFNVGLIYYLGCLVAIALLIYEQSLVKPNDLSKVNIAFFTLNGYVSISFFVFFLVDVLI